MSKVQDDTLAGVTLPQIMDLLSGKGYKVEYPLQRKDAKIKRIRLVRQQDGQKFEFEGVSTGKALRLAATYVVKQWF
jgi:hypothetical protein